MRHPQLLLPPTSPPALQASEIALNHDINMLTPQQYGQVLVVARHLIQVLTAPLLAPLQ
jgi:hypothetical protein